MKALDLETKTTTTPIETIIIRSYVIEKTPTPENSNLVTKTRTTIDTATSKSHVMKINLNL